MIKKLISISFTVKKILGDRKRPLYALVWKASAVRLENLRSTGIRWGNGPAAELGGKSGRPSE